LKSEAQGCKSDKHRRLDVSHKIVTSIVMATKPAKPD